MATPKPKSKLPPPKKTSAKRRSRSIPKSQVPTAGVPGSEHDPKGRTGNFETAGEHARVGGRTSGIVGQTKQKFHTDKRKK
jgi:hypothetical protein